MLFASVMGWVERDGDTGSEWCDCRECGRIGSRVLRARQPGLREGRGSEVKCDGGRQRRESYAAAGYDHGAATVEYRNSHLPQM